MTWTRIILLLSTSVNLLLYSWAASSVFKTYNTTAKLGKTVIFVLGGCTSGILLYFLFKIDVEPLPALISFILLVISLILFVWTLKFRFVTNFDFAFSNRTPEIIFLTGPFRLIRHPFYASYTLTWIAGVVAIHKPIVVTATSIMFLIYWLAATQEENLILKGQSSEIYQSYKQKTGQFFPNFTQINQYLSDSHKFLGKIVSLKRK